MRGCIVLLENRPGTALTGLIWAKILDIKYDILLISIGIEGSIYDPQSAYAPPTNAAPQVDLGTVLWFPLHTLPGHPLGGFPGNKAGWIVTGRPEDFFI